MCCLDRSDILRELIENSKASLLNLNISSTDLKCFKTISQSSRGIGLDRQVIKDICFKGSQVIEFMDLEAVFDVVVLIIRSARSNRSRYNFILKPESIDNMEISGIRGLAIDTRSTCPAFTFVSSSITNCVFVLEYKIS